VGERSFTDLVAEGAAVPVEGWDFSWFEGRATEERPSWGYARMMAARMTGARAALDIQTGGGEVLATALTGPAQPPPLLAATESWPPNLAIAAARLRPLGGRVVQAADDGGLPFAAGTFDLVVSRHPVDTVWPEVARVLRPGGHYFSQQVGAGSNRELIEFMMGPGSASPARHQRRAVALAQAAGLIVTDLREQALRVVFNDVGAVVYFLRKVLWTVPGFTVEGYLEPLRRMHDQIQADGTFVAHAQRFLIEARKP
jgi:SAM-dependent methyltransferase